MTSRIDRAVGRQHHQPVDADALAAPSAASRIRARECSRRRSASPRRRRLPWPSTCATKRAAWSSGSLSSGEAVGDLAAGDEQLEAIGHRRDSASLARASGETSVGCATMNVGCDELVLGRRLEQLELQHAERRRSASTSTPSVASARLQVFGRRQVGQARAAGRTWRSLRPSSGGRTACPDRSAHPW
mgnify:CR=1 FL=1